VPQVLRFPDRLDILDGPNGVVLVSWSGPVGQEVADSIVFDVPPPPPPPTPPACLEPGPESTGTPLAAEPDIVAEVVLSTPADGLQRVLVVLTNLKSVPWGDAAAVVVFFDACGNSDTLNVDLGTTIEPGETKIGVRTYTKVVPTRIEVHPAATAAFSYISAYESCGDPMFSVTDEGNVRTSSEFYMGSGNLLDFKIEALALYRSRTGGLLGADTTSFERRFSRRSDTTPFEVEHSGSIVGLESVETYCRVAGMLGFNP
jgi:hypothetical protein